MKTPVTTGTNGAGREARVDLGGRGCERLARLNRKLEKSDLRARWYSLLTLDSDPMYARNSVRQHIGGSFVVSDVGSRHTLR